MPTVYMMIGVPGSGKSTWIKNQEETDDAIILSTDAFIEDAAIADGKTYNEVFEEYFLKAYAQLLEDLEYAIKNNKDIIWDQTNLNLRTRRYKLGKIPGYYKKVAVHCSIPDDLHERLELRKKEQDKYISDDTIEDMMKNYEKPTVFEKFDRIIEV